MYFNLNQTQLSIIDSVQNIMNNFDDNYWLQCDKESEFPHKFYEEIANGGWLGICMPKEFGGTALGVSEASIFMQKISETGGGMAAKSFGMKHLGISALEVVPWRLCSRWPRKLLSCV